MGAFAAMSGALASATQSHPFGSNVIAPPVRLKTTWNNGGRLGDDVHRTASLDRLEHFFGSGLS